MDLPFRERIAPNVESYLFYRDSMEAELNISVEDAGLQAQGLHTGDSIVVWVSNPKQIPFTYRIGPRSRAVAAGRTESSFFRWTGGAAAGTPYHLEYQYIWGGQSREESLPIQFYENLLQIELDHPPKVTPGEEVGFKVTVKDAQGKPAAGVDLTADAVNAQFGRGSAYSSPEIDYKRAKELRTHAYFDLGRPFYGSKIWKRALSPSWVAKLQLQDSLFYRLRYAGTGVYMEYNSLPQRDSVYRHLAQFAPCIVRRGKTQPVILIYCNRQLVYYYNVGDEPPYSFIGREGYNSVVVRTPEYEYIIDSVWLKNGHKLEIAIDEELFQTGSMAGKIRRKKMPDDLTAEERALLRRRFLLLHERHSDGPVFLWQDATSIHRIDGDQPQYPLLVGPFWNDQPLYFKIPLSWETTFDMESEFSYVLTENRQKLYHHPLFSGPGVTKLPRALLPKPVGETVYTPAVLEDPPATAAVFPRDLRVGLPDTGEKPAGRYQFDYVAPKDSAIVAMALIGPDSAQLLFPADRRDFYPLIPGRYQLILLTTNYYYFQHAFEVQANSLLYEYLGNVPWQHDHTCRIRALFYAKRSTDEPEKNGEKESTSFRYDYRHYIGPGYPIEGTVTDETGEPLIGATILIRGTTIATVSDLEGRYSLTIPYDIAQPEIEVFYTGYSSQMAALDRRARSVDVALEAGAMLQESIVTGYGIAGARTNATASTEELSHALAGKVAGVVVTGENDFLRIRGLRSANTLYFVDGRPVAGIDHLRPEDIAQAYKVEEPKAKAAYGANDLQNVVVITTRNVSGLSFSSDQAPSGIRSLFRDQAFWRPILRTDRKGEAFFKAVFPDNLTSWDAFILGMDGKKRAGTSTVNIQSYKPVTGQLAVPRFLVTGDRTQIVGAAVNYTNDTLPVKTRFLLDDQVIFEKEQRLTGNLIDKMDIEADTDSLTLTYKLETAGYFDGERRSIPVLPKGLSTQKGQFWVLSRDTALIYEPDPQLGPVQLHVQEDILPLLLEDLRYLRSYPYGCNEQTASRLLALLLERDIRKEQGVPFPYERQISRMVERLEKSQNIDGSWGWWAGNGVNEWMSVYVLRALYRASVDGHSTDALEKGLRRLTNRLSQLQREDRLQALELLSETGQRLTEGALQFFDTLRLDLTEQLRLIRIRQQQAMPYTLDSLYQYEKQSLLGGRYWQSTENYRHGSVTTPTLLAYQILRKEGREDVLAGIRQYFLETRGRYTRYGWLNTFETAQILQTILPDISGPSSGATGQETTENLEVNGQKISNFPFRRQYALDQPVRISKSGNRPFFLTVHQEQFLPEPVANRDVFDIHSYWMQQDRKVQKLEAAIPAKLVIEVELKSAAQYVMLQIPIPGGCSYYAKPGAGWGGLESHREYFKDRTVIFCESLPAGLHRFEVELEPRFKGAYTINPVRAEQMYFPTFSGNNACEVMEVGQ